MKLRAFNAENAPRPEGGYSQVLELQGHERLIFISGQIPVTVTGAVPIEFEAQARLVWANVCAQLEVAGMTVANLVKVTTFLASRDDADVNGAIRREVLGPHRPALTVIVTEIFDPSWRLEIEAIAAA